MKILIFLLPLTGLSMIVAGIAFVWAVRSSQFDDLDSPAYRILYDEDIVPLDDDTDDGINDDEEEEKAPDAEEGEVAGGKDKNIENDLEELDVESNEIKDGKIDEDK